MKILGIDHATVHAGFSLFEDGKFLEFGEIDLSKHEYPHTVHAMHNTVDDLIDDSEPDLVALEKPMALKNGDTARKLIEVYTSCMLAALKNGIRIVEVTPQQAKIFTAGHGRAEKDDVARALQVMWGLEYDKIAIPVYYKDKKKAGKIRERRFDTSDACALCVAAYQIVSGEKEIV